jgi:hypothetical protein
MYILIYLLMTAEVTGGNPIAVCSQSIAGVNAINPSDAFYDIHGRKNAILLFCPRQHTGIFINLYFFSCEDAAGQDIDKKDNISTNGFYMEIGTAQVCV